MNQIKAWMIVVVVGLLIVLGLSFCVAPVSAEDNDLGEWSGCITPNAVNYVGADLIRDLKDMGFTVVNDDSCYFLKCVPAVPDDPDFAGAYSCDTGTETDENFNAWINNLLPGMEFGPAYYGRLIDTIGCTDPTADNYMDAQWFPDYNIINGGCEYSEPEIYSEPENAL